MTMPILASTDWVTSSPYTILLIFALLPLVVAAFLLHFNDEETRHNGVALCIGCTLAMLICFVVMLIFGIEPADLLERQASYTGRRNPRVYLYLLLWLAFGKLISIYILRLFYRWRDRRAQNEDEEE